MRSNNAMLTDAFSLLRRALVFPMTLVLASWVLPASGLDRAGAIEAAKREVKSRCTKTTPCNFDVRAEKGNWYVRVEFTKRNSPQEEPVPYPGGHAIFIINQTGKVIGRMEGE